MYNSIPALSPQTPSDLIDNTFVFPPMVGDYIVSASFGSDQVTIEFSGLILDPDGHSVTTWITGGTSGTIATITCEATTALGRIISRSATMAILPTVPSNITAVPAIVVVGPIGQTGIQGPTGPTGPAGGLLLSGGTLTGPLVGTSASFSGNETIGGNLTVTGSITGAGGSFLPLGGGTLTGGMIGTTGVFSGSLTAANITSVGSGTITVGSGSSNHINLSPAATGSIPILTGTGDGGLGFAAQNNKPIKILGGGTVWSNTDNPGFISTLTGTGTSTDAAPFFNRIDVTESLDRSITTPTPVTAFNIYHNYGAGTTKGGRIALNVQLLQQAGANTDSGADNFYVGQAVYTFGRYTQPGSSSTSPLGRLFGLNVNSSIQSGFAATNYYQVAGAEIDVSISNGSSARIRSGLAICDLGGGGASITQQGLVTDNALWLYNAALGVGWRYGIAFGDTQGWGIDQTSGTLLGAKYGAGRNATPGMQAQWGVDIAQVIFPATGNPYDGGAFRSKNFSVDGAGQVCLGSTYLTSSTSGLAIDCKGSIGSSAVISAAGSGYEVGTIVVGAFGGVWTVATSAGVPTGTVTTLVQPVFPSTTPPSNPVTVSNFNLGSVGTGLTLTVTWVSNATSLSLNPSAGATTIGGTLGVSGNITISAGGGSIGLQPGSANAAIDPGTANLVLKSGTGGTTGLINSLAAFQAPSLTLTKAAVTTGAVIGIKQGIALTGSSTTNPAAINLFNITSDIVAATNGLSVFNINHSFGNTGMTGTRNTLTVNSTFTARSSNPSGAGYGPTQFQMNALANEGGTALTSTLAKGNCFGLYAVNHLGPSATFWNGFAHELDFWCEAGSSVLDMIGLQIVGVATHVTQGARDDVGLSLNNQFPPGAGLGLKVGIGFGRQGGFPPCATDGTLIYGVGNVGAGFTILNGIDWNLGTATGNWLNMGGNFVVDGSGNTTAPSYKVGSNKVIGARVTGWGAGSNGSKSAFNGSGATLAQTSAAVAQLIIDLTGHGLLGT